jgi:putative transposase
MINIVNGRNCVYQTAYHVVWCVKDRKRILSGAVRKCLSDLLRSICEQNGWVILSQEVQSDHVHLFLSFPPVVSISIALKKLKGITARKLFLEFPELKNALYNGSFWSPSYYVGTAGNVSAKTIQKYIERAEHLKGRK